MSDLEAAEARVSTWLQPLADAAAPCGPDLEYDNDFLELTRAAQGRPESQFGPAEPPDWQAVRAGAEAMLDRARDLRLAIYWTRSGLHLDGYRALPLGLRLVGGMLEQFWEAGLHPQPDPEDGEMYARANALALLRESEGLVGDLRAAHVVKDRAIGEITGRHVELAAGIAQPLGDEAAPGKEALSQMFGAALERMPELRALAAEAVQRTRELQKAANDKLGAADAPDLRPLLVQVQAVAAMLPPEPEAAGDEGGESDPAQPGLGVARAGRGLSGAVTSRDEALRAIDMVCQYLEQAEPSNPAPLFLRRARQLVNHNFLQLMKELAPDALSDVARIVGVNPDSVETPERG